MAEATSIHATPTMLGDINSSGSPYELFLKQFGSEVSKLFYQKAMFRNTGMMRQITGGRSTQFPIVGQANNAELHERGKLITGGEIPQAERVIVADEIIENSVFVADIDELMNHYDLWGPYMQEIVNGLVRYEDQRYARLLCNAARLSTPGSTADSATPQTNGNFLTGQQNGLTGGMLASDGDYVDLSPQGALQYAGAEAAAAQDFGANNVDDNLRIDETDPDALEATVYYIAQLMHERNIPEDGRYLALRPAEYIRLITKPSAGFGSANEVNKLLNRDYGGNGSLVNLSLPKVAGINIIMSNHVPNAKVQFTTEDLSRGVLHSKNSYYGDFRNTVGMAWHSSCYGTAVLRDITTRVVDQPERLGKLAISHFAKGSDILRPEVAFEITSSNIAEGSTSQRTVTDAGV